MSSGPPITLDLTDVQTIRQLTRLIIDVRLALAELPPERRERLFAEQAAMWMEAERERW